MSLPTLKKFVHSSMVQSTTAVANMEAMMNIMQTTYTVLQSSPILEKDTLTEGRKTFQGLLSHFVTDSTKVYIHLL
jgi:CMP-N-acetylneuraminic acid synthetase